MTMPDEQKLMEVARHDSSAFAPIYETYFPRIYAYCARRTDTAQEAEDITSTVFIKALHGLDSYRGGSVAAWLFRIAHNEMANHWRKRRPQVSLDAHEMDFAANTDPLGAAITREQDAKLVQQIVRQLPDEQQNLLALKLDSGLTSAQIGEIIGKSASAVRVEIHRIMKLLRVLYQEAVEQ